MDQLEKMAAPCKGAMIRTPAARSLTQVRASEVRPFREGNLRDHSTLIVLNWPLLPRGLLTRASAAFQLKENIR